MARVTVVREIWLQASSDYQAVKRTLTRTFPDTATLADVLRWADSGHALQRGDIILTIDEDAEQAERGGR